MSPGELMPCLHASVFLNSTRGHRGTGRRATAAAPRRTAAHTKLPTTGLTREAQASRARGAAGSPGYRPPLLTVTHESYNNYVSQILLARESSWSEICLRWMQSRPGGGGGHSGTYFPFKDKWDVVFYWMHALTLNENSLTLPVVNHHISLSCNMPLAHTHALFLSLVLMCRHCHTEQEAGILPRVHVLSFTQ